MHLASLPQAPHLTYCTNIHAGESWNEVAASLEQTIPAIKARLEPQFSAQQPFGIGLRLSAQAAQSLMDAATLQAFQAQLVRLGAYVFTINAFPYGPFHGVRVKEQVYLPDWRAAERLDYTTHCAHILAQLLPAGVTGSISSVPGAFKTNAADVAALDQIVTHLIAAVAMLAQLEQRTGKTIVLALEPEPCCFLETVDETIAFFENHLWSEPTLARLAQACATGPTQALALMRRHLGVCYDVCHAAVEFEDTLASIHALRAAGIGIGKIQLSCALRIERMQPELIPQLQRFDDGVYLHQVVVQALARVDQADQSGQSAQPGQRAPALQRFTDLPQALAAFQAGQAVGEWRIHCHVPIFLQQVAALGSTHDSLRAILQALRSEALSTHLEVETYTWDVLPAHLKESSKALAIARELAFILKELAV